MSDFILARVSQTLAAEQSLETLVRQLLEMLEAVTRMESTYLTRIDTNAQRQQVSLIFIDLDGFKAINDRFGHPCGDSFLVQVGKRLTAVARRED
ncbi:TPA: diguanylate cyclase, partial [Klebsiella pneumoniae]|nr:diguanylate cyclase [Klebsiella pneumoniae]